MQIHSYNANVISNVFELKKIEERLALPDQFYNKTWSESSNFKPIKTLDDKRFGKIEVMEHITTGEVIMTKTVKKLSKLNASKRIRKQFKRSKFDHDNLGKFIDFTSETHSYLILKTYSMTSYFEYPKTDLLKEHERLAFNHESFSLNQLLKITKSMLSVLSFLHSNKITHGNIRPSYIGFDRDEDIYKLFYRTDYLTKPVFVQYYNIEYKESLYMSPEMYEKAHDEFGSAKIDALTHDLFSLGMTILHLGTGQTVQDCYKPKREFDFDELDRIKAEFKRKYNKGSQSLIMVIEGLLDTDSRNDIKKAGVLYKIIKDSEIKEMIKDNTNDDRIEYLLDDGCIYVTQKALKDTKKHTYSIKQQDKVRRCRLFNELGEKLFSEKVIQIPGYDELGLTDRPMID